MTYQNKLLRIGLTDDPSIMINEITPENFDLFISKMAGKNGGVDSLPVAKAELVTEKSEPVVEPSAPKMGGGRKYKQKGGKQSSDDLSNNYKKHLPELYNLVVLKDKIAEWCMVCINWCIWLFKILHSYIMSIKCKRTAAELEAKLVK